MFFLNKRIFDLVFSFFLVTILFPVFILSIILILFIDRQSPFFFQERSGIYGKRIKIIKLQTMKTMNNKINVTKLGQFLRISKLDEIPQLINVIMNDMSIIGPRPLYIEFNKHYKGKHKLRLKIKPGITGLAQVKVKDSSNWSIKFNFDYIYYKKQCTSLDLFIVYRTIVNIFLSIFVKNKRSIENIDYMSDFLKNYAND